MFQFFISLCLIITILLPGCGGSNPEPLSIPVPFAGALDGNSRVVVANGNPVGGSGSLALAFKAQAQVGCTEFQLFNSNGSGAGDVEFCESGAVESSAVVDGRRDQFIVPVNLNLNENNFISANIECFEFPHTDSTIPPQDGFELRKGICSGPSENQDATVDYRYVAFSRTVDGQKQFSQMLEGVWILHQEEALGEVFVGEPEGDILAVLFENGDNFTVTFDNDGDPISVFTLFCEGNVPCGIEIDSDLNLLEFSSEKGVLQQTINICQGPDSCAIARDAIFVAHNVPELALPDGPVFSVAMTEHTALCGDITGDFKSAVCERTGVCCDPSEDGNEAPIGLDFRCQTVVDVPNAQIIRTLSGAYVISIED